MKENQEEVWDKIADSWKDRRNKPLLCVIRFVKNKKGKILDLGCGSGRNFVESKLDWYGIDFAKSMLEKAKDKDYKELKKANAWEIPFNDDFFDYALYIGTLHCIPEAELREKSLEELKRVLKKGGRALISVWDKEQSKFENMEKESELKWSYEEDNEEKYVKRYYYLYDKYELIKLLEKYFKIVKVWDKTEDRFGRRNLIVEVSKM